MPVFHNDPLLKNDNEGIFPVYDLNSDAKHVAASVIPMTDDEGTVLSVFFDSVNDKLGRELAKLLLKVRLPKTYALNQNDTVTDATYRKYVAKYIAKTIISFGSVSNLEKITDKIKYTNELADAIYNALGQTRTQSALTSFMINFYAQTYSLPLNSTAVIAFRRSLEMSNIGQMIGSISAFDTLFASIVNNDLTSDSSMRKAINMMSAAMGMKDVESLRASVNPVNPALVQALFDIPRLPGTTMSVEELITLNLPIPNAIQSILDRYYDIVVVGYDVCLTPRRRTDASADDVVSEILKGHNGKLGLLDEVLPVLAALLGENSATIAEAVSANTNTDSLLRQQPYQESLARVVNTSTEVYLVWVLASMLSGEKQGYPAAISLVVPMAQNMAMMNSALMQALATIIVAGRVGATTVHSVWVSYLLDVITTHYGDSILDSPLVLPATLPLKKELDWNTFLDKATGTLVFYGGDVDLFSKRSTIVMQVESIEGIGSANSANLDSNKKKVKLLLGRIRQLFAMNERSVGTQAFNSVVAAFFGDLTASGAVLASPFTPDMITPLSSGLADLFKDYHYMVAEPDNGSCTTGCSTTAAYKPAFLTSAVTITKLQEMEKFGMVTNVISRNVVAWDTSDVPKEEGMHVKKMALTPMLTPGFVPGRYVTFGGDTNSITRVGPLNVVTYQHLGVAWGKARLRIAAARLIGDGLQYSEEAELGSLCSIFLYEVTQEAQVLPLMQIPLESQQRFVEVMEMHKDERYESYFNSYLATGETDTHVSLLNATMQTLADNGHLPYDANNNQYATRADVVKALEVGGYRDTYIIPLNAPRRMFVQTTPLAVNPVALIVTYPSLQPHTAKGRERDWVTQLRRMTLDSLVQSASSNFSGSLTVLAQMAVNPFATNYVAVSETPASGTTTIDDSKATNDGKDDSDAATKPEPEPPTGGSGEEASDEGADE